MTDAPPPSDNYQPTTPQPLSPSDERLWATLIHVGGILFYFVPALVGYLVLKDRGPFIRAHTLTALNFQLSMLIYWVAATVLAAITLGILSILYLAIFVVVVVFSIIAAVAANKGETYKYPLTIQFIK
ncbi:putative Tic20 family protein [Conyzicola lurida]|jgi:uncharacterized Tic20 family protein|uniref:Putative Tic20 family protein n=1 Tax=Conyzicola lurida TaxID=1172621 RepID=A0A841APE1_9MICO|nr:DUF4870 domain-containing protein [Conyzicola lurida]MBB5843415.1 putative Tic20 family protein [Conyzicola lurida]